MFRIILAVAAVAVLGLVGSAVYVLASDVSPPVRPVEKVVPDARLPR